ncbi:MAG: bifunctional 5,10-methylenetetrahydrofolate dehydrogenase/5,10-methenyltetrahydrofolate cyclohydrolase [candidate division WOR-3 bacterium]|nr:bifunctional 5,10-methylenetetrahydrofolate dehydrogenase/5,10-methenyltetrahydrofolate cyclohydrolase [candidate division WOR-3 bacterium]
MILETKNICKRLQNEIVALSGGGKNPPLLCCVGFSEDGSTLSYFRSIERAAEKTKVRVKKEILKDVSIHDAVSFIETLNQDNDIDGIIISRPIPLPLQKKGIRNIINPIKDVDCITDKNLGRLVTGDVIYTPPTPGAVIEIIKEFNLETAGRNVVILGRSDVVGKPLALLLLKKGVDATVTVCHSKTKNLASYTRTADILIIAVGSPQFLKADMVRPGTTVIDVGINVKDGRVVGDVDFEDTRRVAGMITPTPGGVGPVTTYILLLNVAKAAKRRTTD